MFVLIQFDKRAWHEKAAAHELVTALGKGVSARFFAPFTHRCRLSDELRSPYIHDANRYCVLCVPHFVRPMYHTHQLMDIEWLCYPKSACRKAIVTCHTIAQLGYG